MRRFAFLLGAFALLCGPALAVETATPTSKSGTKTDVTPEQRTQMADAHEKMAACLRSSRPIHECRDEMMKNCKSMGMHGCKMGGMGAMMNHGMMPGNQAP